jgi:hypothetical protein
MFSTQRTGFRLGKTGRAEIFAPIHILFNANIFRVLQIFLLLRRRQERLSEHPITARAKNRWLHLMRPDPFIDSRLQKTELPANPGVGNLAIGHQALNVLHAKTKVFGHFFHGHHGSFHMAPVLVIPGFRIGPWRVLRAWLSPRTSIPFRTASVRYFRGDGRK